MNLEEEIFILDQYGLSPTELRFLQLLLLLQDENNEDLFLRYLHVLKNARIKPRDILLSLQDKSIILQSYKNIPLEGAKFDPYSIPINKNFIKNLYKCSFKLGKELFEAYPQFGTINNNMIPLRTVAKHFDSLEDCYIRYGKTIGWNPEKHAHIIDLVNWAKENNLINMSLSSFVINNSWIDLEGMKNGDTININYNSIREL